MFEEIEDARVAYEAALAGVDLTRLSARELLELTRRQEQTRRRSVGFDHRLVAELVERNVAGEFGFANTKALLNQTLRIEGAEAGRRVTAAGLFGPRRGLTGEVLPPSFPVMAAAIADGAASQEHADVLVRTVKKLPLPLRAVHAESIEATLTGYAALFDPAAVQVAADRIVATLDPDGVPPNDEEQQLARSFSIRERRDGFYEPHGVWTPELAASLTAALDPLSKPCPDAEGPDRRTAGQRMHDALHDAATRLLASDTLPNAGGAAATILLTITADQLQTRQGVVSSGYGHLLCAKSAVKLADQAKVITVLLDDQGAVIGHGTQNRIADTRQRRLLAARDKGCCFPGCTRPAQWTEVHHVIEWQAGGETVLRNLVLLCGHHHRTFDKHGWVIDMTTGAPVWIPPEWFDPDRKPIRNQYFDEPALLDEPARFTGPARFDPPTLDRPSLRPPEPVLTE